MSRLALPRGFALLRVDTPIRKLVVCSDRLTDEEELIARAIAADRVRRGLRVVLLSVLDLVAVIEDAAAA